MKKTTLEKIDEATTKFAAESKAAGLARFAGTDLLAEAAKNVVNAMTTFDEEARQGHVCDAVGMLAQYLDDGGL